MELSSITLKKNFLCIIYTSILKKKSNDYLCILNNNQTL